MMTPADMHQAVLAAAPVQEDHDFVLVTDGSGTDKTKLGTGSAWVLRPQASHAGFTVLRGACGSTFGSIQRAEMMAALEGFRALSVALKMESWPQVKTCAEMLTGSRPNSIEELDPRCRARVWWICDRENLVLQVARKPDGTTYYARRTEPDLWYGLWWFEHLFRITPVFRPRNTSPDQIEVDRVAGESRAKFLTPDETSNEPTQQNSSGRPDDGVSQP